VAAYWANEWGLNIVLISRVCAHVSLYPRHNNRWP
jgi:hypothetical protein